MGTYASEPWVMSQTTKPEFLITRLKDVEKKQKYLIWK